MKLALHTDSLDVDGVDVDKHSTRLSTGKFGRRGGETAVLVNTSRTFPV